MANVFINLPMPAGGNGAGAAVDVSGMAWWKTIIATGAFGGTSLTIEASVDGGVTWAPIESFTESRGYERKGFAAEFMRVVVRGWSPLFAFSAEVNIGGVVSALAQFAALPMPAANGPGAAVDVSAFPDGFTVIVGGSFPTASINIEISTDGGASYVPVKTFNTRGGIFVFQETPEFVRVSASGRHPSIPFAATAAIGAVAIDTAGGGGGGTLDDAYDFGGAGAGRVIFGDAGYVEVQVEDQGDVVTGATTQYLTGILLSNITEAGPDAEAEQSSPGLRFSGAALQDGGVNSLGRSITLQLNPVLDNGHLNFWYLEENDPPDYIAFAVNNQGPLLPENMRYQFQSDADPWDIVGAIDWDYAGQRMKFESGTEVMYWTTAAELISDSVDNSVGTAADRWRFFYGERGNLVQPPQDTGAPVEILVVDGGAHTNLNNAEVVDVLYNLARTIEFLGSDVAPVEVAAQRSYRILAPNFTAVEGVFDPEAGTDVGLVFDVSATLAIDAAPSDGEHVFSRNPLAIWVESGASRFDGQVYGEPVELVDAGATIDFDATEGNNFVGTLDGASTELNLPAGCRAGMVFRFRFIQGAGGNHLLTFNGSYDWGTAGAPTLSIVAGEYDLFYGYAVEDNQIAMFNLGPGFGA